MRRGMGGLQLWIIDATIEGNLGVFEPCQIVAFQNLRGKTSRCEASHTQTHIYTSTPPTLTHLVICILSAVAGCKLLIDNTSF